MCVKSVVTELMSGQFGEANRKRFRSMSCVCVCTVSKTVLRTVALRTQSRPQCLGKSFGGGSPHLNTVVAERSDSEIECSELRFGASNTQK